MNNMVGDVIHEIESLGFVQVRKEDDRYYFTRNFVSLEYTLPCKDTAGYHRIRSHTGTDITEWHDKMYICYYFAWTFDSMFARIEYLCEQSDEYD